MSPIYSRSLGFVITDITVMQAEFLENLSKIMGLWFHNFIPLSWQNCLSVKTKHSSLQILTCSVMRCLTISKTSQSRMDWNGKSRNLKRREKKRNLNGENQFLYRSVVVKVQSPEALFSLGVVPVVIFATIKSKEWIKASAGWNVGTLEKPEMPLKVNKSCMFTANSTL